MNSFAVHAHTFVLPGSLAGPGYLSVVDGTIGSWSPTPPQGFEIVEQPDAWVAPGYVDIHIHGFSGHDVMDCDAEGVLIAAQKLLQAGTTSWTPTTLTQPQDEIEQACKCVAQAKKKQAESGYSSRIQGIFLEGPFFVADRAGAQNPRNMLDPDIALINRWQQAPDGLITRCSLAPDRFGSESFCAQATEMGVICSLGHSNATYEQGLAAVAAGACVFVHTYNAMSGLLHRSPGLVGCAMATPTTTAELICDGLHVAPGAVAALVAAKGWEHVALVSDCLRCGGMPEGDYMLGDFPIRVTEGVARLIQEDGTLGNIAGSTLTLARAVQNVVAWGVASPEQAIRMASEVPARAAGIEKSCGSLRTGMPADFNILAPDLSVRSTYLAGRLVTEQ